MSTLCALPAELIRLIALHSWSDAATRAFACTCRYVERALTCGDEPWRSFCRRWLQCTATSLKCSPSWHAHYTRIRHTQSSILEVLLSPLPDGEKLSKVGAVLEHTWNSIDLVERRSVLVACWPRVSRLEDEENALVMRRMLEWAIDAATDMAEKSTTLDVLSSGAVSLLAFGELLRAGAVPSRGMLVAMAAADDPCACFLMFQQHCAQAGLDAEDVDELITQEVALALLDNKRAPPQQVVGAMEVLLDMGFQDADGETAVLLECCASHGLNIDLLELLAAHHQRLFARCAAHAPPGGARALDLALMVAVSRSDASAKRMLELLTQHGANINARLERWGGIAPLHLAAGNGSTLLVKVCVSLGANVNGGTNHSDGSDVFPSDMVRS